MTDKKNLMAPDEAYTAILSDLLLAEVKQQLSASEAGHCLRVEGMPSEALERVARALHGHTKGAEVYLLSNAPQEPFEITATKLIELRNSAEGSHVLLVLIPSNLRTAAEDSFDRATFKQVPLEYLESKVIDILEGRIPLEKKDLYRRIVTFFDNAGVVPHPYDHALYLLAIEQAAYADVAWGRFLYLFHLIPDSALTEHTAHLERRLAQNSQAVEILTDVNQALIARIQALNIEPNSIQGRLYAFLQAARNAERVREWGLLIATEPTLEDLDFKHWPLLATEREPTELEIYALPLGKTKNLTTDAEGQKRFVTKRDRAAELKVFFETRPAPMEVDALTYFKCDLMKTLPGGQFERVDTLVKFPKPKGKGPTRNKKVLLDPNQVAEGTYFIRVLGMDESGVVLNANSSYRDKVLQAEWEKRMRDLGGQGTPSREGLVGKLLCDTEDFTFRIEDIPEGEGDEGGEIRGGSRTSVDSLAKAVILAHIDYLLDGKTPSDDKMGVQPPEWTDDGRGRGKESSLEISFKDVRLNFQVRMPTTLRKIAWFILCDPDRAGLVRLALARNSIPELEPTFSEQGLSGQMPGEFKAARRALFERILNSVKTTEGRPAGTPETCDYLDLAPLVEAYLAAYVDWLRALLDAFQRDGSPELLSTIRQLGLMDFVEVTIPLANGRTERAFLASPLHPLRLAWNLQLQRVFTDWEEKSLQSTDPGSMWTDELCEAFQHGFQPSNQIMMVHGGGIRSFAYVSELAAGWGFYAPVRSSDETDDTAYGRALLSLAQQYMGIAGSLECASFVPHQFFRQVRRYLTQHPYVDSLTINIFNPGDGHKVVEAMIMLQEQPKYRDLRYEIRLFAADANVDDAGSELEEFLNPTGTLTGEAEAFIVPSKNPMFPKIRFSRRTYDDYIAHPDMYEAHLTIILEMFPVRAILQRPPEVELQSVFCHGLVLEPRSISQCTDTSFSWSRYLALNCTCGLDDDEGLTELLCTGLRLAQRGSAVAMAGKQTEDAPALALALNDKERTLVYQVHDHSDWVVTIDRNLGVEVFDTKAGPEFIPYLLDFAPGSPLGESPLYLTTRPSSELYGLLHPHLTRLGLLSGEDEMRLRLFMEAVRSVSSAMIMQLAAFPTQALEAIGIGLSRLLLTRLGILKDHFMIPLDVHKDLFRIGEDAPEESWTEQRGDFLLVAVDPDDRQVCIQVVEVKCRQGQLAGQAFDALRAKIIEQVSQTVQCLQFHFDPRFRRPDRVDRCIKSKQLAEWLEFYALRANRYSVFSDHALNQFRQFLLRMEEPFSVSFGGLGLIFEFDEESKNLRHLTDVAGVEFFRAGKDIIVDLLAGLGENEDSLNTVPESLSEPLQTLRTTIRARTRPRRQIALPTIYPKKPEGGSDSPKTPNAPEGKGPEKDSVTSEKVKAAAGGVAPTAESTGGKTDEGMPRAVAVHEPEFTDLLGDTDRSLQYGVLGMDLSGRKVALDLSGCNTISLFGVPGAGKSYTLGTIVEMAVQPIPNINMLPRPLASVIFHFNESQDYPPEFVTMREPNSVDREVDSLRRKYGADPQGLKDIVLLAPADKLDERKQQYPDIEVIPMAFASSELSIKDWKFLMGAVGNQSLYLHHLNMIMRKGRKQLSLGFIRDELKNAPLSDSQREFASQRLDLAAQFIDDSMSLRQVLKPGRLVIVDLRDEFIEKDQALGLFVVMLDIFASAKADDGTLFNKLIVFDEAHKYISNSELTSHVVEVIRQMRHQGVTMLLASQDPPSLPNAVIELSSAIVLHRFNSPQWLKHVQKSVIALQGVTSSQMAALQPGEAFVWANKATHPDWTKGAIKILTRPRVTLHGGSTQKAV